jgi:hypothetical protein
MGINNRSRLLAVDPFDSGRGSLFCAHAFPSTAFGPKE